MLSPSSEVKRSVTAATSNHVAAGPCERQFEATEADASLIATSCKSGAVGEPLLQATPDAPQTNVFALRQRQSAMHHLEGEIAIGDDDDWQSRADRASSTMQSTEAEDALKLDSFDLVQSPVSKGLKHVTRSLTHFPQASAGQHESQKPRRRSEVPETPTDASIHLPLRGGGSPSEATTNELTNNTTSTKRDGIRANGKLCSVCKDKRVLASGANPIWYVVVTKRLGW